MSWSDKEPWQPKFNRLLARIDSLKASGHKVGLVGASAGGSAVINAFAARKDAVVGVVCIAGKINYPETIGQNYRRENPAFATSAEQCKISMISLDQVDRKLIMSRYAAFDETVRRRDSYIKGAHNRTVLMVGHVLTIATQILFAAPSFIHFLKRQTK